MKTKPRTKPSFYAKKGLHAAGAAEQVRPVRPWPDQLSLHQCWCFFGDFDNCHACTQAGTFFLALIVPYHFYVGQPWLQTTVFQSESLVNQQLSSGLVRSYILDHGLSSSSSSSRFYYFTRGGLGSPTRSPKTRCTGLPALPLLDSTRFSTSVGIHCLFAMDSRTGRMRPSRSGNTKRQRYILMQYKPH